MASLSRGCLTSRQLSGEAEGETPGPVFVVAGGIQVLQQILSALALAASALTAQNRDSVTSSCGGLLLGAEALPGNPSATGSYGCPLQLLAV